MAGIGGMLGKAIGDTAGKIIANAAGAVESQVKPVIPPPPVVWYITLRRTPCLHELDQPELNSCSKFCIQMFVVPPAFILSVIGWIILCSIYCFATCCFPLMGSSFFLLLAERSQQRKRSPISKSEARDVAQATFCCAKCLLSLMSFAAFRLIRPFNMFTSW